MSDGLTTGAEGFPGLFRALKNGGLVACLLGALAMIAGRFMPGAPRWITYVGLSVIVFGWGLFAYALVKRAAYRRGRDAGPPHLSPKS